MRTLLAAVVAAVTLATAATAVAAPPAAGLLTRLPGATGCFTATATADCTTAALVDEIRDTLVSPDGRTLYVRGARSGGGSLAAFARDTATGQIGALRNCVSGVPFAGCAVNVALNGARDFTIDAAGRKLYVASAPSLNGSGTLLTFALLSDGTIGAHETCFSMLAPASQTCGNAVTIGAAHGIEAASGVALSPDGKNLYVTGGGPQGGLASFAVLTSSGEVTTFVNCITSNDGQGDPQCTVQDPVVDQAQDVAVASGGGKILTANPTFSGGTIAAYGREQAAGFVQPRLGCFSQTGGTCADGGGMGNLSTLSVNAAGTLVWATGSTASTTGTIASFRVNDAGAPLSANGCVTQLGQPQDSCVEVNGLAGLIDAQIAPDGKHLYTTATGSADSGVLLTLPVAADGRVLGPLAQCFANVAGGGCIGVASLRGAHSGSIAPNGAQLYVAADPTASGGGLSVFQREVGPGCGGASGTTVAGTAVTLPGACSDPNADPLTLEIVGAPANGTASVSGGNLLYTPAAGFTGSDSFTYRASDGTLASPAATATVTVTAAPVTPDPTPTTPTPTPTATPTPIPANAAPTVRITTKRTARTRTLRRIAGTAADDSGVRRVQVAIVRLTGGATATASAARCTAMRADGRFTRGTVRGKRCVTKRYLTAKGTTRWSLALKRRLPAGSYAVFARATDTAGRTSTVRRLLLRVRR